MHGNKEILLKSENTEEVKKISRYRPCVCVFSCLDDFNVGVSVLVEFIYYTLLKIIKGPHVRNVISGLRYMLHFMHSVCQ